MSPKNPVMLAIKGRDMNAVQYCKEHKLNYNTFIQLVGGYRPQNPTMAKWLAQNDPELFNLMPDNSRSCLNAKYPGCNQPNHPEKKGVMSWLKK